MERSALNIGDFWLPDRIKDFPKRATLRTLKDGSVLFWAGEEPDYVYFVEEGYIRVCHYTDEGACVNLLIHGPGEIVGVGAVLNGTPRAVHGVAIGRCRLWQIKAETFLQLMREYPDLAISVAVALTKRMRHLDQQVLRVSALSMEQRVALALMDFVYQEDTGADQEHPRIRMTHQRISNVVGVCRQTITETLSKFRKEGILETGRGYIEILDLQKLSDKANADAENAEY